MFYSRIVFFCDEKLHFKNLSTTPLTLFEDGTTKCTCKIKVQGKREKVIIEYGGFQTEKEATDEGLNLLRNIKIDMCKQHNKVNISGILGMLDCTLPTINAGGFTKEGLSLLKDKLTSQGFISNDTIVLEDILGLAVYEVKKDLSEIRFVAQDLEIHQNTDFKIHHKNYKYWDDKLNVSLSLLSTSTLVNDVRISFLLKIMSLESLVSDKENKEDTYIKTIKNIVKSIDGLEIDDCLKEMIKNDIGRLKHKSIGQKCKSLITKCCSGKHYNNLDSLKFFNNCYKIRSSFVHSGNMNIKDLDDNDLPLKNLVTDVIEYLSENPSDII